LVPLIDPESGRGGTPTKEEKETDRDGVGPTVSIPLEPQVIETIDKLTESKGGTFNDWLSIAVIRFMIANKGYSYAFSAYTKAEFSCSTTLEEAERIISEALKGLDS